MALIMNKVVSDDIRESIVDIKNENTPKVQAEKRSNIKQQEKLTLPEIQLHIDDILIETELKYTVDEKENSFIIKVMDKKTDTIIKEIPSRDIQVLRKNLRNHLGFLFNELI